MTDHEPLREALRHRADQIGDGHPFTLDDVKGRARGIRRRRTALSGLAAAAVLAVAVPVGITVTGQVGATDDPPVAESTVTPSPDGSAKPDTSPLPEEPQRVTLTTEVDETSYAPDVAYLYRGAIVRPDGTEVPVDGEYRDLAPLGDGWAAVRADDQGNAFVDLLSSDGTVTRSMPSTGSLAVSADGTVVSFATPAGELMTVTPGEPPTPLVDPEALPGGTLAPVAVIGSGSCDQDAEGGGCTVYFNSSDIEFDALAETEQVQGAWSATSKGIVGQLPELRTLRGRSVDGLLSGTVSVSDTGSCSVLLGPDGEQAWKTCDHAPGAFSPDGRYVIGHPAYGDGIGDSSVAILDARTGELYAEFQNSMKHQSFINNVVWDTDGTLLATVFEEGTWSLMRMTPAGELSSVLDGIGDDMDRVPLQLATQP